MKRYERINKSTKEMQRREKSENFYVAHYFNIDKAFVMILLIHFPAYKNKLLHSSFTYTFSFNSREITCV